MKHILVVDDSIATLAIAKKLLEKKYKVSLVNSGLQALDFISEEKPDLILLDIKMPDLDGRDVFRNIYEDEENRQIPVIFLTSEIDSETEVECLDLGAVDFISKPFVEKIVLSRIAKVLDLEEYKTDLEKMLIKKNEEIEDMQQKVIMSLANLIESRDKFTGLHVKRTCDIVQILAKEMREHGIYEDIINEKYIINIGQSAPLHDIGKIAISDSILCKPAKLTSEEYDIMKTHTSIGGQILEETLSEIEKENYLSLTKEMVLYHHEKWDGTGYPFGLKGEDIPLSARIMAIADVFDALISERCYKKAISFEDAVEIIREGKGKHFDPKIVEVFLDIQDKMHKIAQM